MKSTTLYFREGGSDKIYQAAVEANGDGYVVNFAYGRRGNTLTTGTKTDVPVPLETANRLFDKLVASKLAKGYKPSDSEASPVPGYVIPDDTGIRPQLLNAVQEKDLEGMIQSPDWVAQEKFDGRRLLIAKIGNTVKGINRNGLRVAVPSAILMSALAIPGSYLLDGEAVGDVFHAFDILEHEDRDLCQLPLSKRLAVLEKLLHKHDRHAIRRIPTATQRWEKEAMFETLRGENREGIVFKRRDAPYTIGRPASGGTALKFKFVTTASCLVAGLNGKRSVKLALLDDGVEVFAGNATIPPNCNIPPVGAIVEIRYLYAFRESGCLFQPVYLGPREDIPREECVVGQLKFKVDPQPA